MFRTGVRFLFVVSLVYDLGAATVPCGSTGKQCIVGQAECEDGACQCKNPHYPVGDGYFACYRKSQIFAELKNDIVLTTFNKESVHLPYPCRVKLTHVQLELRDRSDAQVGTCECVVHTFSEKVKGKFYTKGFDLAGRLSYLNGTDVEFSVRNYGTAQSGANFFTVRGTAAEYLPDGPWGFDSVDYTDHINGISVRNYEDHANNQLVFEALQCGLRITFVPYDTILLQEQGQIPGLSVAISCDYKPRFLTDDMTMALSSTNCQPGMLLEAIHLPGLSEEESMIARAFQTLVTQNQPNPNPECAAGHEIVRACTERGRSRAFKSCYWMLADDRFIHCVDDTSNGETILSLFNTCVSSFCEDNNSCDDVISTIIHSGCHKLHDVPGLSHFISGHLCL